MLIVEPPCHDAICRDQRPTKPVASLINLSGSYPLQTIEIRKFLLLGKFCPDIPIPFMSSFPDSFQMRKISHSQSPVHRIRKLISHPSRLYKLTTFSWEMYRADISSHQRPNQPTIRPPNTSNSLLDGSLPTKRKFDRFPQLHQFDLLSVVPPADPQLTTTKSLMHNASTTNTHTKDF